ncbi:hypothetical protein PFICI_10998 [Pestalotiopsis fici W106-1]|uniref:Zn(2)-C6 fungal-type domain-containing protein n=1 Tax=Pestalotiopsis fici (strain W106-1 / CGMCC3.15140) TaxID=1229662 RepID=W3WTI7_PESFW|nr:uncharacterized protein PFICI_10998 [Pestalotiopsis fici W106-1]ETS77124.1 hypothetical protein PFICI_10998 [Pestalotiopsis fici W106-1]
MSSAVKRACDACHRRKVKCDGCNPCRNCGSASLGCTYNAIPQKKGPKGSRAKVISELRETQRATSLAAKVQSRLNNVPPPPGPPSLQANPGILAPELVKESIDFFFTHMYTIMPILSRQRLEQQAMYMEQDLTTYCMIASLSAFMLLQPGFHVPSNDPLFEIPGANIASSQLLMEEAMRVRKGLDYIGSANLNSLCTSYFLFCSYYALEQHDQAWFHLREATTIAHMMGLTTEEQYLRYEPVESSRYRRLYWQLFISERSYTLKYGRPMSLPLINKTRTADDPSDPLAHQLNNHILLINIFEYFDDTFMMLWNKTRKEVTPQHLAFLQKRLSEIQLPYGMDDLNANQSWLKTVAWHLSQQPGMSPGSDDMTYAFPPGMSGDLTTIASQLSPQSTDLLGGVPMAAKLLDLTCNMADVLSMMPNSGDPFSVYSPQQQLNSLLHMVSVVRGGEYSLLPLLLLKVHETLPRLANPILQRVPDNINPLNNFDMFDGFGTAGMAQPPVLTDFKTEQQYKPESFAPAPVPRADEMVNDAASSNGAITNPDISTPFTMAASSPTIMSPGNVEFPQHMTDYNSIPDMMGTMGANQQQQLSHQQQQQHQNFQQQQGLQQQAFPHHAMHGQMQNSMHTQLGQQMGQQGMTGINQQQGTGHGQGFNMNGGMAQNLMSNILHRTSPPRANSFNAMHQQAQQQQPAPQYGLQRTTSDHVSMNNLGMNSMGTGMDF